MSLRVVGAGIGRTGTMSLKLALERLLGAPCYHMFEVRLHRRDHVPSWHRALDEPPDWDELFEGYAAAVDWPASAFWPELAAAYPDAPVVLSTRESAEAWWRSADRTIFVGMRSPPAEGEAEWSAMMSDLLRRRFTDRVDDAAACMAAYERHNAAVRAGVPAGDWSSGRPRTAGDRSAPRWASPSPTSPSRSPTRPRSSGPGGAWTPGSRRVLDTPGPPSLLSSWEK